MSLYDGTDLDKEVRSEEASASGTWNSGLKFLQSHIQLKKASATQLGPKTRDRISAGATSSVPFGLLDKKITKQPIVVHQLPFFSVTSNAKDSLFDEFNIEDEYNPLYPNDYEKATKRKDEERRKRRDEDRRKDDDERLKRKYTRSDDEDEEEEESDSRARRVEFEKRSSGAAIAPPQSLTAESQSSAADGDKQSYQPDFGMGSKGLNVAAKIMEKYGYRQGLGLGKSEQGMSTALHVEKTSWRGGKIIHERDTTKDQPLKSESVVIENVEPITEVLKNPTKVVLLKNIVGPGQVDEDLEPEIKEEMYKYGDVVSVVIFEIPDHPEEEAVRIFVEFQKVDQAIKAVVSLHGRFFAGRSIRAAFYDYEKFKSYDLAD